MVWYSQLFQNFPQFLVIHTVKDFGIVNKAEIDVFLELSCFFHDPADVGNLIPGMGEFNSDDHYIYYCGKESLRTNGVAIMVNKRVCNAKLGCSLKNNRMISVHFQGKPFNITAIQVYAPTSNSEEAEVESFYEDLQDILELTPQKISFSLSVRSVQSLSHVRFFATP